MQLESPKTSDEAISRGRAARALAESQHHDAQAKAAARQEVVPEQIADALIGIQWAIMAASGQISRRRRRERIGPRWSREGLARPVLISCVGRGFRLGLIAGSSVS
jgi:hypothetical protein